MLEQLGIELDSGWAISLLGSEPAIRDLEVPDDFFCIQSYE